MRSGGPAVAQSPSPPVKMAPRRGDSSERAGDFSHSDFSLSSVFVLLAQAIVRCVALASWSFHCPDQHEVLLLLFSLQHPILHTTGLDTLLSQHHAQDLFQPPISNWFNFSTALQFLGLDLTPLSVYCIPSCAPSAPYRLARYSSPAHISSNLLDNIDLLMRHPFLFTP